MGKLSDVQEKLISMVKSEIEENTHNVDAKELGEVIDIIKDISEMEYYCSIVKAMKESEDEEKEYYMSKHVPGFKDWNPSTHNVDRGRMYFAEPNVMDEERNPNPMDGKSYMSRRWYMEAKESGKDTVGELEKYVSDLSMDLTEMISGMGQADKKMVRDRLANFVNSI